MVDRRIWLAGLGTAILAPYLALDGNLPATLQTGRDQLFGRADAEPPWFVEPAEAPFDAPADDGYNTPIVTLSEALRQDASPQWVVSRWPRVATVVGDLEWSGMRVPLITGSQSADLVGSLTYYFDGHQRLRRISLEGYTGDEQLLVAIATQVFGLQPEHASGAGLYAARWSGEPLSVLSVQYAPIVMADGGSARRRVMLEINVPEPGWRTSFEMKALLAGR